ncbi:MAG: protein phosphatase 2C domain-containing protein [Isosphaeraceae bacterium]
MAIDSCPTVPDDEPTQDYPTMGGRVPRLRVECAGLTHQGRVRPNNEDHFLVAKLAKSLRVCASSLPVDNQPHFSDEEGFLMIVADGMGGAAAGEEASMLAVTTVEEFVLNVVKWFLHLGQHEESALLIELREAFVRADRNVIERAQDDFRLSGMGTTLTVAFSVATDLFLVHAGDSRAYLFRDGELHQITRDHTMAQVLVEGGVLSPEDARHHRQRHIITNAIGGPRKGVHAEIHKVSLVDGDTILLCTDGLTEPVDNNRIAAVLTDHPDPDAACRQLITLALDAGGPDNITAVVGRYQIA